MSGEDPEARMLALEESMLETLPHETRPVYLAARVAVAEGSLCTLRELVKNLDFIEAKALLIFAQYRVKHHKDDQLGRIVYFLQQAARRKGRLVVQALIRADNLDAVKDFIEQDKVLQFYDWYQLAGAMIMDRRSSTATLDYLLWIKLYDRFFKCPFT